MINIVLFGPPGSGKGTQGKNLIKDNFANIIAGDLLREEKKSGSELGKEIASIIDGGNLVPNILIKFYQDIIKNQIKLFSQMLMKKKQSRGYQKGVKNLVERMTRMKQQLEQEQITTREKQNLLKNFTNNKVN